MPFSLLQLEVEEDGIARIEIHRPEKLNALNRALIGELREAFEHAASESAIRGVLLTGAGEKAFVAGADIGELASINAANAERLSASGQAVFRQLETMRKPSVAAINGFALGGGLELAMACTARIAARHARFGQPEVKLGIVPGYGATQRLPRLVGKGAALDMLLTGEIIDAEKAHRLGLVNAVVEAASLLEESRAWLRKVMANGPLAVALTLQAVEVGYDAGLEAGLRFESMAFGLSAVTEDCREGTRAFLEKRTAKFAGK